MRQTAAVPCATYDEALARFSALSARDDERVNPVCASVLLDRGTCTDDVAVLLHGYTNCPAQWRPIAKRFFDRGMNVVVPRLPRHGYTDRMNRAMSRLKPRELTSIAEEAIDIAAGLGRRTTVVGFSMGGALAAWAAANHSEVHEAVLVAPIFSPFGLPHVFNDALMRMLRFWPDSYTWWDPRIRERHRPEYGYPRMSMHGLAALLEVSTDVVAKKPRREGRMDRVVLVMNQLDRAVNNMAARRAVHEVLAPLADTYVEHEFTSADKLSHDLITPEGSNAGRTEHVADVLFDLMYD